MSMKLALDVLLELLHPAAQQLYVRARVFYLQLVSLRVVSSHRSLGRRYQRKHEFLIHVMAPVVGETSELSLRNARKRFRRGIARQDHNRQRRSDVYVAGVLWKAQVHRPMELAHLVAQVIDTAGTQPDQFAQLSRDLVRNRRRCGPLLCCEPRNAERINRVGFRPLSSLLGETSCAKGIQQRDLEAL